MTPLWIYSIGDATMLSNAFLGVAMVFNDGGNVAKLVAVGLVFSLLTLGGRAIMTQKFDLDYFFIGFLMYILFFIPKVGVHVEDAYTATSTDIDNIPIGVAVPMSIVTRIGHWLTIEYETAFTVPSMSSNGYLDSLNILASLEGLTVGTATTNGTNSGEFQNTLTNYVVNCALYDAYNPSDQQEVSQASLETATDIWAALKTTFPNRYVTTWIPSVDPSSGTDRTCADAYDHISTYMASNDFQGSFTNQLKFLTRKDNPQLSIGDAMAAVGVSSGTSMNLMMNALMRNLVKQGTSIYQAQNGQILTSSMMTQAVEQRRFQFATEQGLFKEIARPLMAFIESFVVCLAPIMAFLCVLGPMGINLVGKYFLSVVWISLWPPVMSLVNTYIYFSASKEITSFTATTNFSSLTLAGMDSMYTTVGTWVSTGGLLAASVPALTLTLVYGGAVTASALASRMQSAQHVNSKLAAPDITSGAPVVAQQSAFSSNPNVGGHRTGFDGAYMSYNFSRMADSATSARNSQIESVASNASVAYNKGFGFSNTDAKSNAQFHEAASAIRDSTSAADRKAVSIVNGLDENHTFSASTTDKLMVAVRAGMGLGTGAALPGARANIETALGSENGLSADDRHALSKRATQAITTDSTLQHSIAKDNSTTDGKRFSDTVTKTFGAELGKRVAQTESAVSTASIANEQVNSLRSSYGANQSLNELQMAAVIAKDPAAAKELISTARGMGATSSKMVDHELASLSSYGKNENNELMAAMRVLNGTDAGRVKLADAFSGAAAASIGPGEVLSATKAVTGPDMAGMNAAKEVRQEAGVATDQVKGKLNEAPKGITNTVTASTNSSAAPGIGAQPTVAGAPVAGSKDEAAPKAKPDHKEHPNSPVRAPTAVPSTSHQQLDPRLAEAAQLKQVALDKDVTKDTITKEGQVMVGRAKFDASKRTEHAAGVVSRNAIPAAAGAAKGLANGVDDATNQAGHKILSGMKTLAKNVQKHTE